MREPLSPRKHAIADYGLLAVNLTAPSLIGATRATRTLFAAFGLVQGALNALTDQPLALGRLVPFRLHGRIEKLSGPALVALPLLAGVHRDPRGRAYWAAAGAALVTVYNLTDWNAQDTDR